jgi:hypothetical protein
VPLKRKPHFVWTHPASVISDFDQVHAPRGKANGDAIRACVETVFDQFLERACRPLDDLAGGNAIDEFRRQPFY